MKTSSKTSTSLDIAKVVTKAINQKFDFDLNLDEKNELSTLLTTELVELLELHNLYILDINHIQVYETSYYTFTFETMVTPSSVSQRNSIADAAIKFMNRYTDGDGIFLGFNKLNTYIYQLNFSIS